MLVRMVYMTDQCLSSEKLLKAFGEKIKNLRLQKGWSQKALAELSDLSVRSISQIERGEFDVRLSTLLALADAFGTQVSQLLHGVA